MLGKIHNPVKTVSYSDYNFDFCRKYHFFEGIHFNLSKHSNSKWTSRPSGFFPAFCGCSSHSTMVLRAFICLRLHSIDALLPWQLRGISFLQLCVAAVAPVQHLCFATLAALLLCSEISQYSPRSLPGILPERPQRFLVQSLSQVKHIC